MKFAVALLSSLVSTNLDPSAYLHASEMIDCDHPKIQSMARKLSAVEKSENEMEVIRRCFEFVRDDIRHSMDFQMNPVTCKASDVLEHRTGYCYAKSHLLAALLRANGIPTGLCYQRLTISDDGKGPPYCLHGLNAVYLKKVSGGIWYRIDARGLKPSVQRAEFCPPNEALAFPVQAPGEADFSEIHVDPLPIVVNSLTSASSWKDVVENLPDIQTI